MTEYERLAAEYKALNNGDEGGALLGLACDTIEAIAKLKAENAFLSARVSKAYAYMNGAKPVRFDIPANPITDDWIKTGAEA